MRFFTHTDEASVADDLDRRGRELERRRAELDALATERGRLQAAVVNAQSAARAQRERLEVLERDPQALLTVSDQELEDEKRKLRELLRAQARAENELAEFQREHGDLDQQLSVLAADERAWRQEQLRDRARAKLVELLKAGELVAQLQSDLDELRHGPEGDCLREPLGFPAGVFSAAKGDDRPLTAAVMWTAIRLHAELQFPGALSPSDPVLGLVEKAREPHVLSPRQISFLG